MILALEQSKSSSMKYLGFVTLVLIALASCSKTTHTNTHTSKSSKAKNPTLVHFEYNSQLSAAMEKAQASGKYIFLDFYTDYCPPCKVMDAEVFSNRELADYLNDNFVNVKVNAGKTEGANLASLFGVRAYPTLIFTDERGNALIRKEGGTTVSTVRYMAEEVLRATAMN